LRQELERIERREIEERKKGRTRQELVDLVLPRQKVAQGGRWLGREQRVKRWE
jgi:hypothetical protein